MYEFNSRVRYSEAGPDKHLTLTAIINYFQDCSTFQSEDIGLGIEYLEKENRAWLLNAWQLVIERSPAIGEQITISTWPYDFRGIYGYRNFLMKDQSGNPCAYANSVWVHMDTNALTPTRVNPEAVLPYGHEEKYPMEYSARKITLPNCLEDKPPFQVHYSNLDTNYHVNNGQYILMAENLLPDHFDTKQIRAEYRSSARLGDIIYPQVFHEEHRFTVVLSGENSIIYTIVEFTEN